VFVLCWDCTGLLCCIVLCFVALCYVTSCCVVLCWEVRACLWKARSCRTTSHHPEALAMREI